jgi:hypothetical protein
MEKGFLLRINGELKLIHTFSSDEIVKALLLLIIGTRVHYASLDMVSGDVSGLDSG